MHEKWAKKSRKASPIILKICEWKKRKKSSASYQKFSSITAIFRGWKSQKLTKLATKFIISIKTDKEIIKFRTTLRNIQHRSLQ